MIPITQLYKTDRQVTLTSRKNQYDFDFQIYAINDSEDFPKNNVYLHKKLGKVYYFVERPIEKPQQELPFNVIVLAKQTEPGVLIQEVSFNDQKEVVIQTYHLPLFENETFDPNERSVSHPDYIQKRDETRFNLDPQFKFIKINGIYPFPLGRFVIISQLYSQRYDCDYLYLSYQDSSFLDTLYIPFNFAKMDKFEIDVIDQSKILITSAKEADIGNLMCHLSQIVLVNHCESDCFKEMPASYQFKRNSS